MAEMLYYGLTTGAGVQTLGEEYCDILQVSGELPCRRFTSDWNRELDAALPGIVASCSCQEWEPVTRVSCVVAFVSDNYLVVSSRKGSAILYWLHLASWFPPVFVCKEYFCNLLFHAAGPIGVAPAATQRTLLVLLQTLVPYLAQRVAAAAAAAAPVQPSQERGSYSEYASSSAALGEPPSPTPDPALLAAAAEHRLGLGSPEGAPAASIGSAVGAREQLGGGTSAWAAAAAAAGHRVYAAGSRVSAAAGAEGRRAWTVAAAHAPEAVRLHLALFYFFGVYYHWAKRATGAPAVPGADLLLLACSITGPMRATGRHCVMRCSSLL